MTTSVESTVESPCLPKAAASRLEGSSPPLFSPSSDKLFWSNLRSRVDTVLANRKPVDLSFPNEKKAEATTDCANGLKEDSMLLLRGFDSVAHSVAQLSNNLENALQGARDLARPPTLTQIVHAATLATAEHKPTTLEENKVEPEEEDRRGLKRKLDEGEESLQNGKSFTESEKFKKVKHLAISLATKAASLARELKSIKSDLSFVQNRCDLLEAENRKLHNGFGYGIPPDEDDLVSLQMEALLAEKSRLANENANLKRENQCLQKVVEYHQLTSQDLSASYESLLKGMCLDFSSPSPSQVMGGDIQSLCPKTLKTDVLALSRSLDEC